MVLKDYYSLAITQNNNQYLLRVDEKLYFVDMGEPNPRLTAFETDANYSNEDIRFNIECTPKGSVLVPRLYDAKKQGYVPAEFIGSKVVPSSSKQFIESDLASTCGPGVFITKNDEGNMMVNGKLYARDYAALTRYDRPQITDNKNITFRTGYNTYGWLDDKTNKIREVYNPIGVGTYLLARSGNTIYFTDYSGDMWRREVKYLCPDDLYKLKFKNTCTLCEQEISAGLKKSSQQLMLSALCKVSAKNKVWRTKAEQLTSSNKLNFDAEEKDLLTAFYQKPGSILNKTDLIAAASLIVNADTTPLEKSLILASIARFSPLFAQTILNKIGDKALQLHPNMPNDLNKMCLTKDEYQLVMRLLGGIIGESNDLAELKKNISPYKSLILSLPEAQRKDFYQMAYEQLAEASATNLFHSKILKFVKQSIAEDFGYERKTFTDFAFYRDYEGDIYPVILGTGTLNNDPSTETPYGFYQKQLAAIKDNDKQTVTWSHDGKQYRAHLTAKSTDIKSSIPKGEAPNYESMKKDGILQGMVVASDNLGALGTKTAQQYVAYYQSSGFEFSSPKRTSDALDYIGTQISSGTTDYMFKEAHSAGDDSNIMSISKDSFVLEGVKRDKKGRVLERIEIVYPSDDNEVSSSRAYIEAEQVSGWMRARLQKDREHDLFFVNSSCGSLYQARNQIPIIANSHFIIIPSGTTSTSFNHSKQHSKFPMLEGIRSDASYAQMRTGVENSPRFKKGQNHFMFPHQEEYQTELGENAKKYIAVDISIYDEAGKPYHLSEEIH